MRCTLCCKVTTLTGTHTANNCFSGPAEKHRHFNTPEAIVAHAVVVSKERKAALGKGPWSEGPTALAKNNEQRAMAVRSTKVPELQDGSSEDEGEQQPEEGDDDNAELLRGAYLAGQRDAQASAQQQQQAGTHFSSFGYTGGSPYNGMQWGDIV